MLLYEAPQGMSYLHDLARMNGTTLNGYPIHRSILYDGDVVTFGNPSLCYSRKPKATMTDAEEKTSMLPTKIRGASDEHK